MASMYILDLKTSLIRKRTLPYGADHFVLTSSKLFKIVPTVSVCQYQSRIFSLSLHRTFLHIFLPPSPILDLKFTSFSDLRCPALQTPNIKMCKVILYIHPGCKHVSRDGPLKECAAKRHPHLFSFIGKKCSKVDRKYILENEIDKYFGGIVEYSWEKVANPLCENCVERNSRGERRPGPEERSQPSPNSDYLVVDENREIVEHAEGPTGNVTH
jgi:hypothetical protein